MISRIIRLFYKHNKIYLVLPYPLLVGTNNTEMVRNRKAPIVYCIFFTVDPFNPNIRTFFRQFRKVLKYEKFPDCYKRFLYKKLKVIFLVVHKELQVTVNYLLKVSNLIPRLNITSKSLTFDKNNLVYVRVLICRLKVILTNAIKDNSVINHNLTRRDILN